MKRVRCRTALGQILVVIIVTGAAGAAVGFGLTQLLTEDATVAEEATPLATTASAAAAASTTPGLVTSGGRVRVDVVSTVLHPVTSATGTATGSRIGVHVRITNRTDRDYGLAPPVLLVGEDRHRVQDTSSITGAGLPAVLAAHGVADTTLRFELASASAEQLIRLPLVLRVATKNLSLVPVLGTTVRD
ncbi:MAG TPA: hypothetical protein VGV90_09335 [Solirubrobacteraceae bacterium]|nr:hypothetical protein [Solirubrobacteraceae bacterium]